MTLRRAAAGAILGATVAAVAPSALARPGEPHIAGGRCDVTGLWHGDFRGVGRSRWRLEPGGTARRLGPGGVVGKGRQDGPDLTIEWKSQNGDGWLLYARLDPPCRNLQAYMRRTRRGARGGEQSWGGRLCRTEGCA